MYDKQLPPFPTPYQTPRQTHAQIREHPHNSSILTKHKVQTKTCQGQLKKHTKEQAQPFLKL